MKNAQVTKVAANATVAAPAAPKKNAARKTAAKKEAAPAKADPMAAIVASAAKVEQIKEEDKKAATATKPRTSRKPQQPTATKESAVAKTAHAVPVPFVITGGARPTAGRPLFAHTEAFMQLAGMYNGKAVDRAHLTDVIGSTAIAYHIKQENLKATTNGIELTAKGNNVFKARAVENKFDPKDVEAFKAILSTGQKDDRLVRNQDFIRAIKA